MQRRMSPSGFGTITILDTRREVDFLHDSVGLDVIDLLAALVMVGKWHRSQGHCNRFDVSIDAGLVFKACDAPRSVS